MTNLISAQEAFNALQNGKEVLCSKLFENDFKTLESYPATIFVMPGYEFCIKAELMELAGIQFTKPVEPHDLEDGQIIYIVMPSHVLRTTYNSKNGETCLSVGNGFAQLDEENAKLQLQAIGKTFGNMITDIQVIDVTKDKPRGQKGKQAKAEQTVVSENTSEVIAEAKKPTIVITEQTNVTASEESLVQADDETAEKDDEYQKTLDTLLQRVSESKTPAEVNAVYRYTRTWSDKQMDPLLQATHKRLTQLADEKPVESEPPSLMVQIQNAPDLTTLDALEIDVAARDPQIQPRLMDFIKKRRFELENSSSNEPAYLLEEPF
ncbi:hypothetical protein BFR77_15440 [Acinetobacter pittii]|uniref:hypothetical protein n=1 Tax=Acinetobacter pittii TaxID=48296 RepID=UPI000838CD12|nr:hypothetical protein [Acinetobacter pittii]OCY38131.1 hypothetical protein BFR77_15440 [Acinetobacter pittii]